LHQRHELRAIDRCRAIDPEARERLVVLSASWGRAPDTLWPEACPWRRATFVPVSGDCETCGPC
jgi:hypothetical protein